MMYIYIYMYILASTDANGEDARGASVARGRGWTGGITIMLIIQIILIIMIIIIIISIVISIVIRIIIIQYNIT